MEITDKKLVELLDSASYEIETRGVFISFEKDTFFIEVRYEDVQGYNIEKNLTFGKDGEEFKLTDKQLNILFNYLEKVWTDELESVEELKRALAVDGGDNGSHLFIF